MAAINDGLKLVRPEQPLAPPPDRGRMMTAEQVAAELMGGLVTEAWVRRNVPHKVRLGHRKKAWYELDVKRWIEAQRETAA